LEIAYHDEEWGVPNRDDRHLFEMLTLEGAQAGLSWSTILRKRENYRQAFAGFDARSVARFGKREISRLMKDEGIVRNRLKIESVIGNAKAVIALGEEGISIADFLWQFVGGTPIRNRRRSLADVPPQTEESRAMSRELQRRGFRFVGPTICYALMQAVGMVNDHTVRCFRYRQIVSGSST
jgi:DNA-3-methyladenine glycosylase I